MEILAAKKKKYDEEVFKRKRKLQESRAKAKHLKDKKAAAASAEKAALQVASEEAEREASREPELAVGGMIWDWLVFVLFPVVLISQQYRFPPGEELASIVEAGTSMLGFSSAAQPGFRRSRR